MAAKKFKKATASIRPGRSKSKDPIELWSNDRQKEQSLDQLGRAGNILLSQKSFLQVILGKLIAKFT